MQDDGAELLWLVLKVPTTFFLWSPLPASLIPQFKPPFLVKSWQDLCCKYDYIVYESCKKIKWPFKETSYKHFAMFLEIGQSVLDFIDFTRSFVSRRTSEAWPPCVVILYSFTSSQYLWFSHSGLQCLPFLLFMWRKCRGSSLPCPPCACRASGSVCWGCSKLLKQVVQLGLWHLTDQIKQLSSCCSLWWKHCIILVDIIAVFHETCMSLFILETAS